MPCTRRRGDWRRGLTLSEILVAMAVLIPVAVVTVGMFPYAHMVDRRAWALSQAEDVGRSRLERVRTIAWDRLPASETFTETRDGTEFQGVLTLSPAPGLSPDLARRVTVTISWRTSRAESLRLDTLVARSDRGTLR